MAIYSVDSQDLTWRIKHAFRSDRCWRIDVEYNDPFIPTWIYGVEIAGVKLMLHVDYPDAVLNEQPTTYSDIKFRFSTYSTDKHVAAGNINELDNVVTAIYNTLRHFSDLYVDPYAPRVTIKPNISNYRAEPVDLYAYVTPNVHMVELYSLVDNNGDHLDADSVASIDHVDITADLQARFNIPDKLLNDLDNCDMLQRSADAASVHILHYAGDTPESDRVYKQVMDYITL